MVYQCRSLKNFSAIFLAIITSSACSLNSVGSVAAKEPPRLLAVDNTSASTKANVGAIQSGKTFKARWDRPNAFGPVPQDLQVTGDSICKSAGFNRAIGYHPQALGVDGKAIAGGGFFCGG